MKKRTFFLLLIVCFVVICTLTACNNSSVELNENGKWVVDGVDTGISAAGTPGKDGRTPQITIIDNYWHIDGVNTNIKATGNDGNDGTKISINDSGYWVLDDVVTNKKAVATDGETPTISINDTGFWVINNEETGILARGKDGITPSIAISNNGYWVINGLITNTKAVGSDGFTPTINIDESGYWIINNQSTNVKAKGDDGITPSVDISIDGYWVINGNISDKKAIGKDGLTPTISINSDGYWVINNSTTSVKAIAQNGLSIYELYKKNYGYNGTEEEWISDVIKGTIGLAVNRTISLDYNGAEIGDLPETIIVIDGRTATLPIPEMDGYEFLGWFSGNSVNDGRWTNTLVVSADLNLIAHWKKLSFTVSFEDVNGVLLKQETVLYGEDATPPVAPNVESYVFSSWSGSYTEIIADVTLHPIYVAQRYVVTYNSNGGSTIEPVSYLFTETPVEPINPTKLGFVFDGWLIDGTETIYDFSYPFTQDVTLVAVWINSIKIYDISGLLSISDDLTSNYTLANDIDMGGIEWTPLGAFSGIFDGANHSISNFMMSSPSSSMGFFTENSGTITNVTFSDCLLNNSINEKFNMGVLTAINRGTISGVKILDCSFITNTSVSSQNWGADVFNMGLICGINNGIISDIALSSTVSITIKAAVPNNSSNSFTVGSSFGNVCGVNNSSIYNVSSCCTFEGYAHSTTTSGLSSYHNPSVLNVSSWSGIAGVNKPNAHIDSVSSITAFVSNFISSQADSSDNPTLDRYIGGIVGWNDGLVTNAISSGTITVNNSGSKITSASLNVGGIVGKNCSSVNYVSSSLNIDVVIPSSCGVVGGVVGYNNSGSSVSNSLYNGSIKANNITECAHIIGYNAGTLVSALTLGTSSISGKAYNFGILVGNNTSSGTISKCIIDGNISSVGTPLYVAGKNNGTAQKIYRSSEVVVVDDETITIPTDNTLTVEKSKAALYSDSLLFANNIVNMDTWGICEGLSAYLLFASNHEHIFDNDFVCMNKVCTLPGCNYSIFAQSAHEFINYESNNDSSCELDGTETATCSYGCGSIHTRIEDGSATGHSFTDYIRNNDATCTTCETETAPCNNDNCEQTNIRDIAESELGHYYINGKCVRCDTYDPLLLSNLDTIGYHHIDIDKDSSYSLDDYIYFGKYPQTLKKKNVNVGETSLENGYYLGSDGYEYARVVATPNGEAYKFSSNDTASYGNAYYFRVEPICWQIKDFNSSTNSVVLLSTFVLDNGSFQNNVSEVDGVYYNTTSLTPNDTLANNYEYSRVRSWLNNTFYNSALSSLQQSLVVSTSCDSTDNNVYLLSYSDIVDNYGYNADLTMDSILCKSVSDYAIASGAYINETANYYGQGNWWLRTSSDSISNHTGYVDYMGTKNLTQDVTVITCGIVPAVTISINTEE